jgi:hypothetical protein
MKNQFTRISVFIALFLIVLISAQCNKQNEEVEDVLSISNNQPAKPSLRVESTEVMSISDADWIDYGSIFIDEQENIIYWSGREHTVGIFDSDGSFLFKKKFNNGQGFGDINFFDFDDYAGKYYVFDKSNRRVNIFDKNFSILEAQDLRKEYGKDRFVMRIDKRGDLFFLYESQTVAESKINKEYGIANYGVTGKKRKIEYLNKKAVAFSSTQSERMIAHTFVQPLLRYAISADGNIWVCDRWQYKIYCYLPDGTLTKVIEKEHKKLELKGELIERFKKRHRIEDTEDSPFNTLLPEYVYPIEDFVLIDNKYIAVIRADYMLLDDKQDRMKADLFSFEGKFLNEFEIPKYYLTYEFSNQFKSNICYKKEHIYTLEADEDMENFYIKKYKLKITEN